MPRPRPPPPPPPQSLPPPPLPRLVDGTVEEILLRLPPDDPVCLFRASVVCKPWRSIVMSPTFRRRYVEFHRAPPMMLGFLEQTRFQSSRFISTSSFRPSAPDRRSTRVLDARHGRVLLENYTGELVELVVWEPITDREWRIPLPPESTHGGPRNATVPRNAAVLCAGALHGCDNLDCHGGPFLVALLYTKVGFTSACVYSSEAGAWSDETSQIVSVFKSPSVLVGSTLYFDCGGYRPTRLFRSIPSILRYDLLSLELSVIQRPVSSTGQDMQGVLMTTEDSALGFAGLHGSSIYLLSSDVDVNGAVVWVERRVIKLATLLPAGTFSNITKVAGFAEGVGVIFLRTDVSVFAMELKSGTVWKVPNNEYHGYIFPYMSFCTPVPRSS